MKSYSLADRCGVRHGHWNRGGSGVCMSSVNYALFRIKMVQSLSNCTSIDFSSDLTGTVRYEITVKQHCMKTIRVVHNSIGVCPEAHAQCLTLHASRRQRERVARSASRSRRVATIRHIASRIPLLPRFVSHLLNNQAATRATMPKRPLTLTYVSQRAR